MTLLPSVGVNIRGGAVVVVDRVVRSGTVVRLDISTIFLGVPVDMNVLSESGTNHQREQQYGHDRLHRTPLYSGRQ